ncbi:MAG: DUF937 domain-containing protein [Rubripirellula sp.]
MPIDVLDDLYRLFDGELVGRLGTQVDLGGDQAKFGIDAIFPAILGGLMKKASTPQGADSLGKMLSQDDFNGRLLEKLPGMFDADTAPGDISMLSSLGWPVLESLFGDSIASVAGVLSKHTGIGPDKSTSLMAILAPLVLSYLGSKKRTNDLDSDGVARLLVAQKDTVASNLPPGMAETLGLRDLGIADPGDADLRIPASSRHASVSSGGGMVWWLPVLVVVALTAWFMLPSGRTNLNKSVDEVVTDAETKSSK